MNKLDPKSHDTSEALGASARGAGGSHTQKTECVSTAAHRCSRFLLVPASPLFCHEIVAVSSNLSGRRDCQRTQI